VAAIRSASSAATLAWPIGPSPLLHLLLWGRLLCLKPLDRREDPPPSERYLHITEIQEGLGAHCRYISRISTAAMDDCARGRLY
jgi:hypothetical protein